MISVKLLAIPDLKTAALAARVCTGTELKPEDTRGETGVLVHCLKHEHLSVFEHLVYTFSVSGCSRALLQELARHRHISLSVRSTRYTLQQLTTKEIGEIKKDFERNTPYLATAVGALASNIWHLLEEIKNQKERGAPNDVLKYFLPEVFPTEFVMTVNARELMHIFKLRTSTNVLKEFRFLCLRMWQKLPNDHLFLFDQCCNWKALQEEFTRESQLADE